MRNLARERRFPREAPKNPTHADPFYPLTRYHALSPFKFAYPFAPPLFKRYIEISFRSGSRATFVYPFRNDDGSHDATVLDRTTRIRCVRETPLPHGGTLGSVSP